MHQPYDMRRRTGIALVFILGLLWACGGGGGAPAVVPVMVPALAPAISAQPLAVGVADGSTASFSVTATGDAPLAYQWRRDGVDLVDAAGVAGAKSAALSLLAPYGFNASQVSVRVSNGVGSVISGNALLTVSPLAPVIATQPAPLSVIAGSPATFSVVISGGTAPLSYQWTRNGSAIAGATGSGYTLPSAAIGDSGASFAVAISNPAGTLSSAAALLMVAPAPRTWGPAQRINAGNDQSDSRPSYPQVAMDSAGNAISVWLELVSDRTRYAVFASRYLAGGMWNAPEPIDAPVGSSISPQIAMTPGGKALAVFTQSTANNGGGTQILARPFDTAWGATLQRLDADVVYNRAHGPQVALAPDGAATVVFTSPDTSYRVWATHSNAAGAWGTAETVGASPSDWPQVAVAPNGQAVMTWLQPSSAGRYMSSLWASRNAGAGWNTPLNPAPVADGVSPLRVATDADGDAIAVWQQNVGNRASVFASRLDASTNAWSAPIMLNEAARLAFEPQVAVDGGGNAMVVWYERDGDGNSLGVQSRRLAVATGTWGDGMALQPLTAPRGSAPQLAACADGRAIVIWCQPVTGNSARTDVWGAHFDPATGSWQAPVRFMHDAAAYTQVGSDHQPRIAVNDQGEAVVVWFEQTDAPLAAGLWTRVYR